MNTLQKPPQVAYLCQGCGQYFAVPQGSRRRYCVPCDLRLRRDGWMHRKAVTERRQDDDTPIQPLPVGEN